MAGNCCVGCDLRPAGVAEFGGVDLGVHLAALRNDRVDRALSVEAAAYTAGAKTRIQNSGRTRGIGLRRRRSGHHGARRATRQ